MKHALLSIITLLLFTAVFAQEGKTWELVWSDEFERNGLPDNNKWNYDVGDGCPRICGWGNQELQYYFSKNTRNSRVEDGKLIIEAHKEVGKDYGYSSARLVTKGKGDWTYGKVEVRAKLPKGRGTWPAIWMLPSRDPMHWPNDGEIDIMEHVGHDPGNVHGSIHTEKYNHMKGTQKTDSIMTENVSDEFHTYQIIWNNTGIEWSVDGTTYLTVANPKEGKAGWPFDNDFHLILNVAVGGFWGGIKGVDDSIWPQRMEVEYVRVYRKI